MKSYFVLVNNSKKVGVFFLKLQQHLAICMQLKQLAISFFFRVIFLLQDQPQSLPSILGSILDQQNVHCCFID